MTHSRDNVIAAIRIAFPAAASTAILAVLDQYGTESYENDRERVQLAIIQLSGGVEGKLPELVRVAKTDYRDVLAWQQLGPLSDAEGQRLQEQARALLDKWGEK